MNASLEGLKRFHKRKSMNNLIVTEKGRHLNDREARQYIDYCLEKGYKDLYSCPEYEDVFK